MQRFFYLLGLLAVVGLASPLHAAIRGPYNKDGQTLHLWHLNEGSAPALDAVGFGSLSLTALANGATLNSPSAPGFGTALNTVDGGQSAGSGVLGKDAVLAAQTPVNGAGDNVPWSFASPTTGAFTFEAIVRIDFNPLFNLGPTNTGGTGRASPMAIIDGDQDDVGGGVRSWQFRLDPLGYTIPGDSNAVTQPTLEFVNRRPSGQTQRMLALIPTNGANAILSNQWYHLAATYNGVSNTANNFKIYWTPLDPYRTNANQILSDNMQLDLDDSDAVDFTLGNTGRHPPTNNFVGLLDEVRISSVARAADAMQFFVDTNGPVLVRAGTFTDLAHVIVEFSEALDVIPATDSSHYTIPGATVLSANLLPDAKTVMLTLGGSLTEGNSYTLTILSLADLFGNIIVPNSTLVVFQAAIAPMITSQPQGRAVFPGGTATFTVASTGTAPKSFQWFRGNNPLPGETGVDLSVNNVQLANLGDYHCEISNAAGAVTSAVAKLEFLVSLPVNLPAGYSFVSKPLASSSPQFPFPPDGTTLWKWNTGLQSYVVFTFTGGVGWDPFEPVVAVGEGVVIQLPAPATLNFVGTPVEPVLPVSLQPGLNLLGAQTPKPGGYAEVVGAPQEGSVIYRYKPGGDPAVLSEPNYQISFFRHGMWNDSPPPVLDVAEAAWFSLVAPVVITVPPVGFTNVTPGQSVTFSVTATGTGPLTYQWRLNGTAIPGATNTTYPIQSVNPSNAGIYSVVVGNAVGDLSSTNVPLTINAGFFNLTDDFAAQGNVNDFSRLIASHNRNATVQTNEPLHAGKKSQASVWLTWTAPTNGIVTMSTAGSGFDTILAAYRGTNVANLILMDASDDDAGYACSRIRFNAQLGVPYRICVASLGPDTGNFLLGWNLEITAQVVPVISAHPQNVTVGYGDTAQFTVTATNGNFSYQWFRNGAILVGASAATLTINNVGDSDVGNYFVRVSSAVRFRDSLSASLQVEVPEPGQPLSGARVTAKFFDVIVPGGGGSGTPLKDPSHKLGGTVARGYSGAQTFNSVGAGKDPDEPNHCGIVGGNSVWYAIQATNDGTMYLDTDGSSFNTLLAAYIGPGVDFLTLTNVACDNNSGLDGLDSRTSFAATSNTIYYVAVDGVAGASGTVKFHYHLVRPLILTNLVYSAAASGSFTMKVITTPALTNVIHYRTNMTSTNWVAVLTNTSASGTFNYTNTGIGTITNRYYRAINRF